MPLHPEESSCKGKERCERDGCQKCCYCNLNLHDESPTMLLFRGDIKLDVLTVVGCDQDIIGAMQVLPHIPCPDKSDRGRIRYVMEHRHGSCFEHNMIRLRVEAPIFVWREWHRHRIGFSYNEESARYKQLDPVFFIASKARKMIKTPEKFKASRPKFLTLAEAHELGCLKADPDVIYNRYVDRKKCSYEVAYRAYVEGLDDDLDPGLARDVLPVGIYSSCWVTCNLRSALAFMSLRTHEPAAKYVSYPLAEIELAARQLEAVVARTWPLAYEAFNDFGRVGP